MGQSRPCTALMTNDIMLKLDITEAFDKVDWAFLFEMLPKLGFGHK
jgi:hypothetical protein